MGTRDTYAPGTFSWAELETPDADAAKAFYAAVFNWDYDDRPTGDNTPVYSMANLDGKVVGGLYKADAGPPHWNSFVSVESVDESTEKAEAEGAAVVSAPFDVMEAGRMSVVQDPSGAVVSLWQAGDTAGAEIVNVPGALCWNDLMTHDVDKAVAFYTAVLGWEVGSVEGAPGNRHGIRVGERMNGGIAELPESAGSEVMPHWLVCFACEDVERTVAAITDAGGASLSPTVEVPSGHFAVVADPAGAIFGIVDGDMDD